MANLYRKQIFALWEEYSNYTKLTKRFPLWYTSEEIVNGKSTSPAHIKKNVRILFIGLNPSDSEESHKSLYKTLRKEGLLQSFLKRLDLPDSTSKRVEKENLKAMMSCYYYRGIKPAERRKKILYMQKQFRRWGKFFTPIHNFAELIGNNTLSVAYKHIDLFAMKTTDQHHFESLLRIKIYRPFFEKQLGITMQLIDRMDVDCIVVLNALVSRLMNGTVEKKFIPYADLLKKLNIDYHANNPNNATIGSKKKPVFFASQLSGGASDIFSQHRLAQIIRKRLLKEL
jgi:hypothetical protein